MKPKIILTFLIFIFLTCLPAGKAAYSFAEVRYVSKTGTSTPPYITWETASDSIQKAINICNDGDTVIVANGVYKEFLIIDSAITLLGMSMDSTIIDGTGLGDYYTILFEDYLRIKNFTVIGKGINKGILWVGIGTVFGNLDLSSCRIKNCNDALNIGESSGTIESALFTNCERGIFTFCGSDTCRPIIKNSVFILKNGRQAISLFDGGQPVIENNILMSEDNSLSEISIGISTAFDIKSSFIMNNSIVRFSLRGVSITARDTAEIINNNMGYRPTNQNVGFIVNNPKYQLKNNIIYKTSIGIEQYSYTSGRDYNQYWGNDKNINNGSLNVHEIEADPMFVKDTIPTASMSFDFHLQKYSPAIDAGDPNILDADGTRSDIGAFGGTLGETYTYQDLPPKQPTGLTVLSDSNSSSILIRWEKNSEADFMSYKLYRDTIQNFIVNSTKLISIQTDTTYSHLIPPGEKGFYYKLTAADIQGNESEISEEVGIILVSVDDDWRMVTEYHLLQNYPNPFNPNTIISYRLKERGFVKLTVYDIKGELIKTLADKEQEAGFYEVEFSAGLPTFGGQGLASGIYLYRIEVTGKGNMPVYSDMKKMILLK